jgi:tRNA (guanine-N7-)-methyltransferase
LSVLGFVFRRCIEIAGPFAESRVDLGAKRAGLDNVRVVVRDAVEVIEHMLDDRCVDAINLFFPDPWPKKRHHKRRLVQPEFLRQCARILEDGGLMHIATDWSDYAEHTREVFGVSDAFEPAEAEGLRNDPLAFRPPTKFERRGQRLGHDVWDLFYRKRGSASRAD